MRKSGIVRGRLALAAALLAAAALSACSGLGGSGTGALEDPADLMKVRVSLWDRSNSPDGTKLTDAFMVKYIRELAKEEGLDVEFVTLPRSQESEKNNMWLASGSGPDIIITYDINSVYRWAEQGGLWELDGLIEEYGQDIKKLVGPAMEAAGTYRGVRYAIPAIRMNPAVAATMSIRKDWLDKLGLPVPRNVDELADALRAFKEQDPGGVGKERVVPWALSAIHQGMQSFFYGPMYGFGVVADGPGSEMYWPSGNFTDGEFKSMVRLEEGKRFFRWMNRLYKEGLISKEFVTDVNNQIYNQQWSSGVAGFLESNTNPWSLTRETRKHAPEALWVTVPAFENPHGVPQHNISPIYGLFNVVPKSTKHPEAAIRYLNFMAKNISLFQSGIEGVHYREENGLRMPIDSARNMKEIDWYLIDLNLLTQGYMGVPTKEQMEILYAYVPEEERELMIELMHDHYQIILRDGKASPLIDQPRPVAEKRLADLVSFMYEALSKVIIAEDFEAEWEAAVAGWIRHGGIEYDREITEALLSMGWVSNAEKGVQTESGEP